MIKKVSGLLLAALILVTCFSGYVLGAEDGVADAIKGTPVIDGEKDAIWDNAKPIVLAKYKEGSADLNAQPTVYVMWDEDNMYILADVKDDIVNHSNESAWLGDCVEIYIEEVNEKATGTTKTGCQWLVTVKNDVFPHSRLVGANYDNRTLTTAVKTNDNGYVVEIAFPWVDLKGKVAVGTKVGADFQVDDDSTAMGLRDGTIVWLNGTMNASTWGTINLVEGPPAPAAPAPVAPTPSVPAAPVNPSTGDSGMTILYTAAALAGSGIWFGIRKRFSK